MIETPPSLRVWQVELGNRADLVFMLRDFLRRSDIEADVSGPASVALTTGLRTNRSGSLIALLLS